MDPNTPKTAFLILIAVLTMIVLPVWTFIDVRKRLQDKNRNSDTAKHRSGAILDNAFQELDRLVARPSVEYTVEAETPILKREDDRGGD
jgi:hypothetical protein